MNYPEARFTFDFDISSQTLRENRGRMVMLFERACLLTDRKVKKWLEDGLRLAELDVVLFTLCERYLRMFLGFSALYAYEELPDRIATFLQASSNHRFVGIRCLSYSVRTLEYQKHHLGRCTVTGCHFLLAAIATRHVTRVNFGLTELCHGDGERIPPMGALAGRHRREYALKLRELRAADLSSPCYSLLFTGYAPETPSFPDDGCRVLFSERETCHAHYAFSLPWEELAETQVLTTPPCRHRGFCDECERSHDLTLGSVGERLLIVRSHNAVLVSEEVSRVLISYFRGVLPQFY